MNGDQHDQLITICIFDSTSVTVGISQAKPIKNVKMLLIFFLKSYRCPKFDGDARHTLEIRVERKRNLKFFLSIFTHFSK